MKVCDHCQKKTELDEVKIGSKKFELCRDCLLLITDWIEKPYKPNKLQQMFGGN